MAAAKRAFGDITNTTNHGRAEKEALKPPFFKSEKMAALINYYKSQSGASTGPCIQFFDNRTDVIAHNIQQQPFLVPITDRACSKGVGTSDQRQELWSNLTRLSFDEICNHLDSLLITYDRNSPKDFLVDTLRRYLITDIN